MRVVSAGAGIQCWLGSQCLVDVLVGLWTQVHSVGVFRHSAELVSWVVMGRNSLRDNPNVPGLQFFGHGESGSVKAFDPTRFQVMKVTLGHSGINSEFDQNRGGVL